jgi:hypothetical protein
LPIRQFSFQIYFAAAFRSKFILQFGMHVILQFGWAHSQKKAHYQSWRAAK